MNGQAPTGKIVSARYCQLALFSWACAEDSNSPTCISSESWQGDCKFHSVLVDGAACAHGCLKPPFPWHLSSYYAHGKRTRFQRFSSFLSSSPYNACVAKCQVTRLIVVNPTPLLEPLVLKRAIHNFSFSKLTLWKLEMHRLVGPFVNLRKGWQKWRRHSRLSHATCI